MTPQMTKSADGQMPAKLDEAAMQAMRASQEAFIASLTETQKASYDELFGNQGRSFRGLGIYNCKEMTDEEKAQMEEARVLHDEKLNTFNQSLSSEQKVLFESITLQMEKSSEDKTTFKHDDVAVAAIKENKYAFIASLTETQKALYDELTNKTFRVRGGAKAE